MVIFQELFLAIVLIFCCVKTLIANEANVNAVNGHGASALVLAAIFGHPQTAEVRLEVHDLMMKTRGYVEPYFCDGYSVGVFHSVRCYAFCVSRYCWPMGQTSTPHLVMVKQH